jgi:hypothetical protein
MGLLGAWQLWINLLLLTLEGVAEREDPWDSWVRDSLDQPSVTYLGGCGRKGGPMGLLGAWQL